MALENMDFQAILTWQFYLVAACCGALGEIVKRIPHVPTWLTPITNTLFGVIAMMALLGATPLNALAGILAASVATFVYEIFKGIIKGATDGIEHAENDKTADAEEDVEAE